jgi:biofilm PGA synthesis N-glycosyltransferase PgaC
MLTYAVITPARNEESNLPRLAEALRSQTSAPSRWLIVENGSTDGTRKTAHTIAAELPWAEVLVVQGTELPVRGAPIVRSLHEAIGQLVPPPHVVVNVDADISMDADYFERLLAEFAADPELGIGSGSAFELENGRWRQRHVTGGTVWGASRAYRWQCLQEVMPLEERFGWDGIDEAKARARGWNTTTFTDLPFKHHRAEGVRDSGRLRRWAEVGRSSWYLDYRVSYLLARTLHQAWSDPAAIAILWGFAGSALRRRPKLEDSEARRHVRAGQRLRNLPRRRREALGRSDDR